MEGLLQPREATRDHAIGLLIEAVQQLWSHRDLHRPEGTGSTAFREAALRAINQPHGLVGAHHTPLVALRLTNGPDLQRIRLPRGLRGIAHQPLAHRRGVQPRHVPNAHRGPHRRSPIALLDQRRSGVLHFHRLPQHQPGAGHVADRVETVLQSDVKAALLVGDEGGVVNGRGRPQQREHHRTTRDQRAEQQPDPDTAALGPQRVVGHARIADDQRELQPSEQKTVARYLQTCGAHDVPPEFCALSLVCGA